MLKIPRQRLLSEIRTAGFRFIRGRQRNSDTYRRRGGTEVVAIPTTSVVTEEGARRVLRRAGRTVDQIEAFIASCRPKTP